MDHFPLLSLPRELRDYAYAFMVTCPEVVIHATELKNGKEATSEAFPSDEDHNLATRRYNRSTFESTMEDRTRTYTYSMEPDAMGTIITKDFFNVFLTSRQVYKEASAMFYSKNEFSFMGVEQRKANPTQEDMSIPAALAFFRDTQPKTLRKISRIGLCISDSSDDEFFELGARVDGTATVALCQLINQSMQVKNLHIQLCGDPLDVRVKPWDWAALVPGSNHPPKWLGALLTLNTLTTLHVSIQTYLDTCEAYRGAQEVAFARLLRSHLLRNGHTMGKENISVYHRHDFDWVWNGKHQTCASRRNRGRVIDVECFDDEHGNSFLTPPIRAGPRVRKLTSDSSTPKDSHGHKLAPIEDGWSDDELEDYASSDGGSNDSLIDLSGRIPSAQTVPVDDQEYFNLFERDALEV